MHVPQTSRYRPNLSSASTPTSSEYTANGMSVRLVK